MRKVVLLLVLMVSVFATSVFAQKYAILKPAKPGEKSDVIPITKKQLDKLLKNEISYQSIEITHSGVLDTITNGPTYNSNFGCAVGDTIASYYNPPAACYIKAVGIIGATWSTSALGGGWNLLINKPAIPWEWSSDLWDGDAVYFAEKGLPGPLGEEIWGAGGFPVTVDDGNRVWTEMIFLGYEPDTKGEPFVVSAATYGEAGAVCGLDLDSTPPTSDADRIIKFYGGAGRSTTHPTPQWVVRDYTACWLIAVEFYQNTGPTLAVEGTYGSVLNADARTIKMSAEDIDANDATQAGVAKAEMFYSINGGAEQMIAMSLESGTDTDGIWSGTLPSGYMAPGDVCAFRFEATDKPGLMSSLTGGSFGYFVKTADVLFYYNDIAFTTANAKFYYWNESSAWLFDTWVGETDGAAQDALLNMYDYIVRVDGGSPTNLDSDVFQAWLATGTADKKKHLFWSSQEFLGAENGWVNTTYAADDWHNMYLGISAVNHDLQYTALGGAANPADPWPVNAVLNDPLTGALAKFCADSSFQLLHNPVYEIGAYDWSDHVEPGPGAVTCITDSASGVSMGVWKDGATTKTVFLGLDQIALDINPPYGSPGYNWPEFGDPNTGATMGLSILKHSLVWFAAPTAVDDNVAPGVITDYSLSQNYPNPFNPETKISFSIAKAGNVSLAVYNVVGQKVADLVNGQKAAGKYQITWNANDLASGVYFYRLEVGDFSRTMKMMLLR